MPSKRRFSICHTAIILALGLCGTGFWLLTRPDQYRATTQVRVREIRIARAFGSFFPQEEEEHIRSNPVLLRVIDGAKLDEKWSGKFGEGRMLTRSNLVGLLRKRIEVQFQNGTGYFDINLTDDDPREAAQIANLVAESYRDFMREQQQQLKLQGVKTLDPNPELPLVRIVYLATPPLSPIGHSRLTGAILSSGGVIVLATGIYLFFSAVLFKSKSRGNNMRYTGVLTILASLVPHLAFGFWSSYEVKSEDLKERSWIIVAGVWTNGPAVDFTVIFDPGEKPFSTEYLYLNVLDESGNLLSTSMLRSERINHAMPEESATRLGRTSLWKKGRAEVYRFKVNSRMLNKSRLAWQSGPPNDDLGNPSTGGVEEWCYLSTLVQAFENSPGISSPRELPEIAPAADADLSQRHAVEITVPTGFRAALDGDVLEYNFSELQKTNLTVGYKMTTGVECSATLDCDGIELPLFSNETNALIFSNKTNTFSLNPKDEPLMAAKRCTFIYEVTIFETDVPVQHQWAPRTGKNFKVLWKQTFEMELNKRPK
ncbi:hypothetical protein GC207_06385 [bacterium]|nr:hypothetical protein [bacterium]